MADPEADAAVVEALARFHLGDEDLEAWRRSGLPKAAFEGWLTDRVARQPGGSRAREVYGAENVHDFARAAVLEALDLAPGDRLLEVGCGGGLLLRDALSSGAKATGIDHSHDMVELAREWATGADVLLADAEHLPFADSSFTAVAMSVVFFFFERPLVVLSEAKRVLAPAGRMAIYTTGPELRGTPAAPEPMATLGHFYSDEELAALAERAGFAEITVRNREGGQLLSARLTPQ